MLELRRLRYLVVLANRLNYSRAAADLGLSQSALTRAIQSLENEIGMRLFDRDQAGVRLTEQGRWMTEKAEVLLINANDFNREVNQVARGTEGRVRIGMSSLAAQCLAAPLVHHRLNERPRFVHEVLVREPERLWLLLAQGEIEFLVCEELKTDWPIPESLLVKSEPLGPVTFAPVARSGHPLARKTPHLAEAQSGFPVIVSKASAPWVRAAHQFAGQIGSTIQIIEEFGASLSLALTSNAIWWTARPSIERLLGPGSLCVLPMPDNLDAKPLDLSLFRIQRRSLSPVAQALVAELGQLISKDGRRPIDQNLSPRFE